VCWQAVVLTASWYAQAVGAETSPYVRGHLHEILACFQLDPLPTQVLAWVQDLYDHTAQEAGEFHARQSAIQVVRSAATSTAFHTLRNFGLTVDGNGLVLSGDALADVAEQLVQAGDTSVITDLLTTIAGDSSAPHRLAAEAALLQLAGTRHLSADHATALIPYIDDPAREDFERSILVSILGVMAHSGWQLPAAVRQQLEQWAADRTSWLGGRSLLALAHAHTLMNHTGLLTTRLNLQQTAQGWTFAMPLGDDDWGTRTIGILFEDHPDLFEAAMANVLQTQEWPAVAAVRGVLGQLYSSHQQPLPPAILAALIQRINSPTHYYRNETALLWLLADITPPSFVMEPWPTHWTNWKAETKAALADVLGTVDLATPELRRQAGDLLVPLTQADYYSVRRAAFRALARIDEGRLEVLCQAGLATEDVELRQRATEGCAWLTVAGASSATPHPLCQQARQDPEPSVREAAQQALLARRKREWAARYLQELQISSQMTNAAILAAWPYAQALTHVGDDTTLRALRRLRYREGMALHVTTWLERIITATEKNWEKVMAKWPGPQAVWEDD